MKPMTHEEAQTIMRDWIVQLADEDFEVWAGIDSSGPFLFEEAGASFYNVLVRLFP